MSAMQKKKSAKTQKGDQTKALILETALEMFQKRGYEQTTMRAIAEKANLSLGNAYYYFPSKEHLIQAFYHRTHELHLAASVPALEKERTLKARLLTVMRLKIETIEPYHEFAAALFKTAAHPQTVHSIHFLTSQTLCVRKAFNCLHKSSKVQGREYRRIY